MRRIAQQPFERGQPPRQFASLPLIEFTFFAFVLFASCFRMRNRRCQAFHLLHLPAPKLLVMSTRFIAHPTPETSFPDISLRPSSTTIRRDGHGVTPSIFIAMPAETSHFAITSLTSPAALTAFCSFQFASFASTRRSCPFSLFAMSNSQISQSRCGSVERFQAKIQ